MSHGLDEQLAPGRPMILPSPPHTTTLLFCLDAHPRALDECSTQKTRGLILFIQPRKRPSINYFFPLLDTTATNERTSDSTSMTMEENCTFSTFTACMPPTFDKTLFSLLCLLLLLPLPLLRCDLYIWGFFSSLLAFTEDRMF